MKRVLQLTEDGSHTIAVPGIYETYHSKYGAIQESMHVYIEAGLKPLLYQYETIQVFEMGFGTGLNALLSFEQAILHQQKIYYYSPELFPLQQNEYEALNYVDFLKNKSLRSYFIQMHESCWNRDINIHDLFTLHKTRESGLNSSTSQIFNLIYFDAFAPNAQPELWKIDIFKKMFSILDENGILVTYCSKGNVHRAMQTAGFVVEKLKGAAGKREMLRAIKNIKISGGIKS